MEGGLLESLTNDFNNLAAVPTIVLFCKMIVVEFFGKALFTLSTMIDCSINEIEA